MPRLEEVFWYLQGYWLMLSDRGEGLKRMDFTPRGFIRSFWAIVYCLPPIVLGWLAFRVSYLAEKPEGTQTGAAFFFKLAAIDMASWVVPLAAIGAIVLASGHGPRLLGILVAFNWLTVPSSWILSVTSLMTICFRLEAGGYFLITLVTLGLPILILQFMVLNAMLGDQKLFVTTLLLANVVLTMYVNWMLQAALGLS